MRCLETWPDEPVQVVGHVGRLECTDEAGNPTRCGQTALLLGERMAESVAEMMVENGVDPNRLEVISRGDQSPVCEEETVRCSEISTRVELSWGSDAAE